MKLVLYYFLLFFIYSVLGWIVETVSVSFEKKKFINRGFLIGPYCPIYGWGCLFMIFYLTQYRDNVLTVFILGVVICSALEYFTSYIMEKLFKTRWWDYSDKKFNFNGRICGMNSVLFGLGGVFIIYFVQPFIEKGLNCIPNNVILFLVIISFVIFLTDSIISFNVINRFKNTVTSLDLKRDSTQDFKKMVQDVIRDNHQIFQKRLLKAFPNVDFKRITAFKEEITGELKDLLKK